MRKLVLFDIDGTLIASNQVGTKAMYRAMEGFLGSSDALRRIHMAGMVDWGIWREALGSEGYSADEADAHVPDLWRSYVAELAYILASPEHRDPEILPGVCPLLKALDEREDILLGLLTGNIEPGAWLKLGKVGLDRFFRFGAFGNDAAERPSLPAVAVERAATFANGHHFTKKEIVIIGDTVHDIACGESLGVCAIGIATGPADVNTLCAAGADYAFESLEDWHTVLDVIVGA